MFLSGILARGRTRVKASDARSRTRALRWLAPLAWMAWIFYLSQQSTPLPVEAASAHVSFGHVALYGGLALLLFWALHGLAGAGDGPLWLVAGLAFALTVLYGAADEVHQAFVAGRTASEADLGLDAAGALLAVLAVTCLPPLLRVCGGGAPHATRHQ